MSAIATDPAVEPLTRSDRCDRCGAAATGRARLSSGGQLLFCGHHLRAHSEALIASGAMIHAE